MIIDTAKAERALQSPPEGSEELWRSWLRGGEQELRQALAVIRRRKTIIVATVALVTLGTLLLALQLTPSYTATAVVGINVRNPNVVNVVSVVAGLPLDPSVIKSEIDVLRSPALAARVIAAQHLDDDPELAPSGKPGLLAQLNPLQFLPPEWRRAVLGDRPQPSAEQRAEIQRARIIDAFLKQLEVTNDARSYSIAVSFHSRDPAKAARIANAVVQQYLDDQLQTKLETTKRANSWLTDRLAELRDKLRESELAVQDFRLKANLEDTTGPSLAARQLDELASRLVQAEVDQARLTAEVAELKTMQAAGTLERSPAALLSGPVQRLRARQQDLQQRKAELGQAGSRDQQASVAAALAATEAALFEELQRVVAARESELAAATRQVASIRTMIVTQRAETAEESRARTRLSELQQEADADRALLATFLVRAKETAGQNAYEEPDARVIAPAQLPVRPTFPRIGLMVAGALAISTLLGIGLAFLLEQLQNGFRLPEEVEQRAGLPVLRVLPAVAESGPKPHELLLRQPTSAYGEAVQAVRAGVRFAAATPPKVVLVTSGTAGEGKSTLALSLALSFARAGQRTVLVDADMRRPAIGRMLGLTVGRGLEDVLGGGAALNDALVTDPASGLWILPARAGAAQPQELLGGPAMSSLLRELRASCDMVIIDSPPVTFVSDAALLATQADGTLFVIRWESTPREVALAGLQQLRRAGAVLLGAVLTRARLRRHEAYAYGMDSGYYAPVGRSG
ncbi:MAG: polysaccharide biosynthesis tyrosine autokinase [Dongiaceae bacterium]